MVKSTWFRWGGTDQPSDGVYKYDPKKGTYFPTSFKQKGSNINAKAGPFSFKTDASTESKFTWTPLSAEFKVGASFALNVSTKLGVNPAGMSVSWTPKLPEGTQLPAGAAAGITGAIALITGFTGMTGGKSDSSKMAMDISAYMGLISAALALLAIQKNITFKMNLPLLLDVTVHPLLVVSKEEGEKVSFSALENKTDVFKWKNNISKTWAALGVVRNDGAKNNTVPVDTGANAVQTKSSVIDNQS